MLRWRETENNINSEVNSSIDKINLANSIILIAKLSISKAKALASLNNVLIIFECERGLRYCSAIAPVTR